MVYKPKAWINYFFIKEVISSTIIKKQFALHILPTKYFLSLFLPVLIISFCTWDDMVFFSLGFSSLANWISSLMLRIFLYTICQGPPSFLNARGCCPQNKIHSAEQLILSIFLNSFCQCRINTYIYIVLWIFHRLNESTWIYQCIKMYKLEEWLSIILGTLTIFLNGELIRIPYLLLYFTNKPKKIQKLSSNQCLILHQLRISPESYNYTISPLGKEMFWMNKMLYKSKDLIFIQRIYHTNHFISNHIKHNEKENILTLLR